MVSVIANQFNWQRDQILAHLDYTRIGQKGYTRKDWLQDLLDWAQAAESMKQALQPIIHATLLTAGRDASQQLGLEPSMFDPFTPAITEYFQNRATKVAADINDETEKQLRASLNEGVLAGESSYEMRARVEQVMGFASTVRADRIASYETTHAQSYGDIQAWTQSGVVEGKEWYSARDEKVCPGCNSMDGTVIGLQETYFDQGDTLTIDRPDKKTPYKLKLDYEDIHGPSLHNRCRCVLLPIRKTS